MNLKTHLFISAFFLLLIFGALAAYEFSHAKEEDKGVMEDRFIQITTATYGKNCNGYLEQARKNADSPQERAALPESVKENNVLRSVSALCNGKEACRIPVSGAALGADIFPYCDKELVVDYRCFMIDRIHRTQGVDGDQLILDCRI